MLGKGYAEFNQTSTVIVASISIWAQTTTTTTTKSPLQKKNNNNNNSDNISTRDIK